MRTGNESNKPARTGKPGITDMLAGLLGAAVVLSGAGHGTPAPVSAAVTLPLQAAAAADPRKALPAECRVMPGEGGAAGYFERSCLVAEFAYWPFLPDLCETRIDGRGDARVPAYPAACLAGFGYHMKPSVPATDP